MSHCRYYPGSIQHNGHGEPGGKNPTGNSIDLPSTFPSKTTHCAEIAGKSQSEYEGMFYDKEGIKSSKDFTIGLLTPASV